MKNIDQSSNPVMNSFNLVFLFTGAFIINDRFCREMWQFDLLKLLKKRGEITNLLLLMDAINLNPFMLQSWILSRNTSSD